MEDKSATTQGGQMYSTIMKPENILVQVTIMKLRSVTIVIVGKSHVDYINGKKRRPNEDD